MTAATTQAEPLCDLDRQALDLAITIDRERNKACREQIDDKLRTEPWFKVAKFAVLSKTIQRLAAVRRLPHAPLRTR
jgi:hypothetical protein